MIGFRPKKRTIFFIFLLAAGMIPTYFINGQGAEADSISVSVTDVKLEKVLRILSDKSGMEFISDPALKDKLITLDLQNIHPLEALSILTELYDLGFQQLGDSEKFFVADKSEIQVQTQLNIYACEFSQAKVLAATIAKVATPTIGIVFADERTNTVIYRDTPLKLGEIERLLQELDKPTRQVYIRGAIAEVSITRDQERGVQWFGEREFKEGTLRGGKIQAGTNFSILNALPIDLSFPDISSGLGVGIIDYDIDIAIGLLSRVSDLNLLSSPYLITLDNQSAVIEVGDQIPYPKLNEYGVTSYEFKDATIRLKIRPHINNDSTITVFLEPQANFQQGFTPDNIPIIAKRSAQTQVVVENGKTVVLGGLMRESDVTTHTKVPILGSIPLVGVFFKSTKVTKLKTELVVMITPKIVDLFSLEMSPESHLGLPEDLREKLR